MYPARKVGGPRHPERVHERPPDPEEAADRPLVPKEAEGPVDKGGGEAHIPPDHEDPRAKSSGHGKKTADKWNQ